jgi:hypothetical protein
MWSEAVFEPALPGRRTPESASPRVASKQSSGRDQGGVDVEDEARGWAGEFPHPAAGACAGFAHASQVILVEGGHETPGGRVRSHGAEEHLLVAQDAEVTQGITAVGEHDPEIAQDPSGLVPPAALPKVGEGF